MTVEGPTFSLSGTLTTHAAVSQRAARAFAAKVNSLARQLPPTETGPTEHAGAERDVSEQIRKFAALRDDGLITSDEFEEQKKRLLELE